MPSTTRPARFRNAPPGRPGSADTPAGDGSYPDQPGPTQAGPSPVRRRRPLMVALAVVLLAVCGLGGAALFQSNSRSSSVVEVRRTVPRGSVVTALDLTTVTIGQTAGVSTVPANQLASQVGLIARYDLTEGSLLNSASLTSEAAPASGRVQIGLRLQPGQIPTEAMMPGTPLQLVYAPSGNSGGGAAPAGSTSGSSGSAAGAVSTALYPAVLVSMAGETDGTAVQMTVDVPTANAAVITRLAAAGNIGVIRLSTRR